MKQLIMLAAAFLLVGCSVDGNQRKDQVGETVVGQSMARAKDAVCMDNLKQIRAAIEIAKTSSTDESDLPQDMSGLKIPGSMQMDPIGKEPYVYDPKEGTVKCVHPGHEKY